MVELKNKKPQPPPWKENNNLNTNDANQVGNNGAD